MTAESNIGTEVHIILYEYVLTLTWQQNFKAFTSLAPYIKLIIRNF